jgi:hypothetical protein
MTNPMRNAVARIIEPRSWAVLGLCDTLAHKNRRTSSLRKAEKILAALSAEWCPPAQAIEQAKSALLTFALYYQVNDCKDMRPDEALEVSVRDLKEAFDAFRALMEPAPSSSDNHPSAEKA